MGDARLRAASASVRLCHHATVGQLIAAMLLSWEHVVRGSDGSSWSEIPGHSGVKARVCGGADQPGVVVIGPAAVP